MSEPKTAGLTVREASAADAEGIWHLHVRSIRELCAAGYTPQQIDAWAGPKRPEHYRQALAGGEVMYVAEAEGELLGFVCAEADEIRGLYVAPAVVGQGVGSALLKRIEADAHERGLKELRLHSTVNAVRFYAARGYVAGERTIRMMGAVSIPCIPMVKPLHVA
jgi:putative acetyltransferase